ncbi:hypothetical protein AgCh_014006 [Apium graveolens]
MHTAYTTSQTVTCAASINKTLLWHNRLGHVPPAVLKLLPMDGLTHDIALCDSCLMVKQTRFSFPNSHTTSFVIFELVHIDLWGPYHYKTHVPKLLTDFLQFIKNHFTTTIKTVRSDNGSEFLNKDLASIFDARGILHQTKCVYTPQQNGLVERKHRTLLNVARSLRFHSSVPINFWGDCLLTACYVLNKTPSSLLGGLTPYEILHKTALDFLELRVFGSLCFATVVPHPTEKFAPRAIKGVFVGYPFGKKGYKVYDLHTRQIFVARDVSFYEDIFLFKNLPISPPSQLFPVNASFVDSDPLSPVGLILPTTSSGSCSVPAREGSQDSSNPLYSSRPTRIRTLPSKFADYTGLPYIQLQPGSSLQGYVDCLPFDPISISFIAYATKIIEPISYKQVVKHSIWCEAMSVELAALEANHTWSVEPFPPGKKIVECKWLYKVEYLPNGAVDRYKALLVAKGFTQTAGLDYFETFAPVAKMATLRILLTLAAKRGWCVKQPDVTNAFLHGIVNEEVDMALPPGYTPSSQLFSVLPVKIWVCRLLKYIYGLKQAPHQWFIALSQALLRFGFVQLASDSSLFQLTRAGDVAYVLIYVDDMLLTGSNFTLLDEIVTFLDQPVDLFTKALASSQLHYLLFRLGVCDFSWTPHLQGNGRVTHFSCNSAVKSEMPAQEKDNSI